MFRMTLMLPLAAALVASLATASAAAATAWAPVGSLRHAAETAVLQARPGATVHAQIDANVRLARCDAPVQATVRGDGATPSVMLSCAGPHPWTLYVPVQVQQRRSVLVLTQPVGAGQTITQAMLQLAPRNVASLSSGYFSDPATAVGAIAARPLPAGAVLSTSDVRAAPVIRRGQSVTLEYRTGALTVSALGQALGNGAPGQIVRVQNAGSHRIISGVVDAQGRVQVGAVLGAS
ncbi:MAG TPA: flagellar basal body P-ring formation chaperone FlgA [Nevskiaceae bacterium]|nr:flagellar basal body P-ring formation chaperone FlgA [Nevskiaceae bacterium]